MAADSFAVAVRVAVPATDIAPAAANDDPMNFRLSILHVLYYIRLKWFGQDS